MLFGLNLIGFKTMKRKEIISQRCKLEATLQRMTESFEQRSDKIWRQLRALQKECPHASRGNALYTRWCNDCGWSEDCS